MGVALAGAVGAFGATLGVVWGAFVPPAPALAVATTDGVTIAVAVAGSGVGVRGVAVASAGVGVLVTVAVPPLQLVSTITTAIAQIR